MSDSMEVRKQRYKDWAKDNLGEKTGIWYAPYLEKLGSLLNRFGLGSSYFENFFYYKTFDEFQEVYQKITGDTDSSLSEILKGKRKNYTKEFVEINETFKQQYAKMEYENGTRSQPTNYGGIAQLGTILRSYLKFLFYAENPEKTYPKKEQKTSSLDGQVDDSVNYWVYAPGEDARLWEEFYASGVMGLGWDFLGDLEQYENRNDVEKVISEHRNDDKRPTNDSKAVWDFYREIKPGDIVYAKAGVKRIVGRGVVTGDYEEEKDAYAMDNVFFVPMDARWSYISSKAHTPEIGQVIDDAMRAIEKENKSFKGVLPMNYANSDLDKQTLSEVVDMFTNNINLRDHNEEKDLLGRTYEYFIEQFAAHEGKGGGEFYTPTSIVKTIVAVLKPFKGRVYDMKWLELIPSKIA